MKKFARNFLKSADEKLRNIGNKPQGSKQSSPSGPSPHEEGEVMAERRIQTRTGRRERFRGGDGVRGQVEHHKAEIKRRSRSEGPHSRVSRPKEDETFESYPKNEKIMGPIFAVTHSSTATRVSRYSPPLSDEGGFVHVQEVAGSDTDSSDSDRKVWTKNPLVVRKTRRTGRSEKRQSNIENGFSNRTSNRESFVYYGSGQDKSDSSGTGSLKGSKYQKLEELRRRRIDIQVTSDEEVQNTPASRISRLRQRAIQSGLGKQDRHSSIEPAAAAAAPIVPSSSNQSYIQKTPLQNGTNVYSNQGQSTNVQPVYQVGSNTPSVVAPKSFQHSSQVIDNSSQNKVFSSNQKQKRQSQEIKPFDQKGFSDSGIVQASNLPANFTVHSQIQHNISEPQPSSFTKTVHGGEIVQKKIFDRPRVPSADSIYDSVFDDPSAKQNTNRTSFSTYHNVGHGFVYMRPASGNVMEKPKEASGFVQNGHQMPATSNEVVELRLKTNRVLDRPPSIQGTPAKLVLNRVNSDDSLDELIESNIQYLDQEIDKSKRRSTTHVSKSASLPDSRHFSGLQMPESGVIMPVRSEMRIPFSGSQSQGLSEWQHPKQTHISRGSELQFHIPVGTGTYHPPEIYIADENRQGSFSSVHSEMAGQTNTGYVGGMYGGASLHPGTSGERKLSYDSRTTYTFPGSEFHDRDMSKSDTQLNSNLPVYRDTVNPSYSQPYSSSADPLVQRTELSVPTFDRGMFSDVEYNIEVADRVKKWEKFMKKRSEVTDESLTTIQEQDILPRDVRRSMFLDQRINIPKSPTVSVSQSFTWTGVSLKPSSSDPTINMAGNQHVFSQQTNHIVIQEPVTGSKYATSALSSIYVPGPQKASPGLMSAADLRKHMVANKQPVDDHSVQTLTSPNPVNCRYQELDELQEAKSETVKDLCKMFDISFQNEGQVMPGEEKFSKMSPSQADSDTNWTQLISDLETKIKETEVWSPEMESQEGDLVSIERVKARTLQTIPFSEDPFWKEIEEMTSFEKLFKPEEFDDALAFRSANQLEFAPSQSNTLPSQPRMSARDRLTRSKSLYTPNITPLTITVDKYNGPNALDDVLEDIRVSLEKQSPKVRRGGDSSDSHRSSPGPTQADIQRSRSNYWERTSVPQTQGLLIYATQNQTDSKPQMSYPGMEQYPNVVNGNYQLDPDILKQKLLKTGLVDENKKAVTRQYQQKPSPLIIPPPPQFYAPAPQPLISQPIRTSRQSEEKRNEVNQSMEELRQLAVDVERKVSMIKSKIVRADENNLDKILMTLKKFAPTVQSRSPEPKADSFHDFYVKKKSKLSEALFELDKIYDGLQLDDSSVIEQVKRQDYPPYRRPSPIGQQKQDEKPEISSSISFQVSKPAAHKVEQRTDTDFDAIQRSFQAILDEVNQTAATKTETGTVPANVMSSRYQPTVVKTATSSFSQPRLQTAFNKTITTSAPTPVVSSQVQTSGAKTVSSTIPTTIVQPTKTETVPSKPSVVSSFQQVEKSPEVKRRSIVSSARTVFQPAVKSEKEGIQAAVSSTVVDMAGNRQNSGKSGVIPQMPVVSSLKTKIPPETSPKPKRQNLQSRRGVSSVTLTPAPVLVPPETSPKPKRSADKTLSVTCVALSSSPAVAYSSSTVSMPRPKPPQTTSVSQTPTKQVTKTSVSVATTQNPPTSACSLDINQRENLTANVSKLMNQTSNQAGGMTQQSQSVSITLKTPTSSSSSSGQPANAASMQTSKSPRERRSRTRFRAKNPDLVDDDVAVRKARSKSTPRIDSQTTAITPSPTSADYLNPRESTPPQSRIRIRPEKEADLMHDDMAYRNLRKDITVEPPKMPTTTTTATACSAIEIELKSPVNSAAGTPQTKPKFDKTVDLTKAKNFTDRSSSASSSAVDSPKLKTVETQTSADEQKSARSRFRQRQEGKRRMGKGIAMMLEIFSSSDDDRRMRPLHTRSAPDLSLIGNEGDDEGAEEEEEKTKNEIHVTTSSGQREMQAEHFGDNKMKLDSVDCSETSATNKPPAHPVKKSSGSPEKITSSSAEQSVEKDVSCSEKFSKFSLRTRKGRSPEREVQSDTTMEIQERPKSFHELLANFEQGENRRHALKSLRKCASEDTVAMETVVKKAYQSDPYLSEPNLRQDDPRIPSQEGSHILSGQNVDLLTYNSSLIHSSSTTRWPHRYSYRHVSTPREFSLTAPEPFSKIYAKSDTTMSRYTSPNYEPGSRRYDTSSSYKSFDSGSSYRRPYGLASSASSYSSPRSFTLDSSSAYSPAVRSYSSTYTSRSGSSDSATLSRISTRTSASKWDDASKTSRDILSSRNGRSSPHTSLSHLSSAARSSPRSSISSEPSLERESPHDTSLRRSSKLSRLDLDRRSDSGSERDISRHRDNGKNSALDDYRASRRAKENSQESDVKRSWRTRIDEYKTKNDDTGSTESDPDHRSVRQRPAFKESSSSEQSTETNYRSKYRNQKSANGDKTENVSMKETVKDSYTESGDNVYIPFNERKKQFDVKKSVSDADDAYIPFSDRKKKHLEDVKENETKPEVVNIAVTEGSGVEESNRSDVAEESLIKVSQFKDIARKISDSSDSHATDELDALKKAERIARYKEERRKQFAAISNVQTNDSQPLESQNSLKTADQDNNKPDENVKIIPAHGDGIAASDKDVTGSGKANASSDKVRTPRRRLPDIPVQSLKEKEQRLQDFIHSQARYLRQGTDSSTTFEDKLSDKRHSPVTKPAMTTNGVKRTSSLKTENSRPQDKTSVNRRVSQKESTNSNIDSNSPLQHVKTSSSLSASPRESPVSDKNSRLKNQLSPAEHSNKSKETKAKHSGSDRYTPKARRSKSDISLSPRSVEVIKSHTNITEYSRESESPDTHHDTKSGTKSSKSDQLKLQQIASFKNTGELASHRAIDDNDSEVRNKTGKKDDDSLTPHAVTSSGNLDDLLKENANYLSDVDLDLPDLTPLSKKSSTNDSSLRRSLRKKKLVRSSSSKGKGDKLKAGAYSDLKRNSREDTNSTSPPDLSHRGKEDSEASTTSVTKKETNNARKSLVYPEVQAEPSPSPAMRKKDIPEDDKQLVTNKDSVCGSTESENFYSAPSTPTSREYVKKKKKDKSALRKSALNMRDDDEDSSKNGSTCGSSLDSSNVTQNRVSDMKTPSKVTLTQHEQVPPHQNTSVISPLHASTASVSIISRAKALQEKVKKANESKPAEPEEILPRPIRRGKDFHQLLSKFSSSETSGSDPDPASTTNTGRRVLTLCRQDNIVVSSSDESNTERRTPERTSSFQYRSPTKTPIEGKVQRSGSFKSEFMKRRYSVEKSDKPDDELQAVLCQRSNIVEKQQVEAKRKLSSKESRVEKAPERKASDVDEVIADREVLAVLKARRKETDAKTVVDNDGESANRTDDSKADIDKLDSSLALLNKVKNDLESPISSSDLDISSSSYIPSSSTRKKSGSENISEAIKYVHDVETSISTCISSSLSNTKENGDSLKEANTKGQESHHVASKSEISEPEVSYTVSLSNSQMPNSINKTDKRTSEEKRLSEERDFAMPLAKEEKWVTDRRQRREPRAEPGEDLWSDVDITDEVTLPTVHSAAEVTSTEKQTADNGQTAQLVEDSHTSGSDAASVTVSQRQSSNSANNAASVSVHSTLTATTSTPESPSVPNVTNLRRAESLKESSSPVHRTDSFQKRKGILKRTPSLPKQSSPVIVDKELAQLLQKQKSKCEDTSEDELNERTRTKSISALEEIDEISRREKRADDEDESMKQLSVTQRIFAMQKKIEEEKLAAITPKSASQSGYTTPKSALKIWCQNETGAGNKVNGDSSNTQAVSGEQLIEKLNKLSEQTNVQEVAGLKLVHKQRERFQQRHRADDWRRKTQPVTVDEVKEADSLESVFAFRALVRRQSSKNVFQHLKELEMTKKLPSDKKPEFPQHAIPNKLNKRRNRLERYHTQPVTADELNAIPEGQESPMNSNFRSLVKNDSKADSGILSGSEVEMSSPDCLRSFSLDMDNNENDPVSLSVSAKTSIFRQMEEKTKAEKDKYKASASGAKRYIDRKRRERIRTQPVTEDEVKTASEIAERTESEKKPDVANRSQSVESETENSDELAGLSVVEKVRLFSESKAKKDEAVKHDVPVPRRRARKQATRFATQPVTTEEVVKAASLNRVSPLAATLIKPPEPDILQGLPLAAQRELIVLHAQQCLSQPSSRRSSFGDMDQISKEDSSKEADSKETQVKDSPEVKGILKHQVSHQSPDHDVKSILKTEKDKKDSQEPKSILKRSEADESSQKQNELVGKGILKHSHSLSKSLDGTSKGILKASDLQTSPVLESNLKHSLKQVDSKLSSSENSLNRGILKSGGAFDNLNSNANCEIGSGDKKHDLISPQTKSPMHKESVKEKQTDSSEDLEQKNDENNHQEVTEVTSETVFYISDSSSPEKETTPERSSESTSVKRKSRFQDRKSQGERYLTQPADLGASKSPVSQSKKKYEGRHMTQPITPEEMKEAEAGSTPVRATSSISERLNALKQSGETSWKKRLPKQLDYDTPVAETKLRSHSNRDLSAIRPSSIADRLSQIEVAKGGWKERVEEKDQTKFTVAGKLSKTGQGHTESPLVARLKQTPKREGISLSGDSGSSEPSPVTSPSDPKEFISPSKKIPIPKEIISDEIPVVKGDKQKGDGEKVEPVTVEVPKMVDQELDSMFFQTKDISEIEDKVECDTDDFNEIFIQANDILPAIRRVRPSRRKPAQSQNPLKTMSQHIEIKQEYTQVDRGVAELEFRRFKKEQLSKETGFAQEALAGLASKENFSKIELRKMDEASTPGTAQRYEPFKNLMLLHIKGRRTVQTRLVEPSCKSLNSGDCFILVTPDKVIHWIGEFSNVIEKAKSSEIASVISTKKDLGCRSSVVLTTVDEVKSQLGIGTVFWSALGGQSEYQACGPDEEDELFESHLIKTNMVYRLVDNSLEPYEKYWGVLPKYEMLKKEEVLVFDFGGEMYLWMGTAVSMDNRKRALKLAQKLWDRGYDYSECNLNPLSPLRTEEDGGLKMADTKRPDWALFGKVSQNMETVLFREKFSDWPDTSRIIRCRGHSEEKQKKSDISELKPCDVKKMLEPIKTPVSLFLEGSHVGRGTKWKEDVDGLIREFDVLTLSTATWHVLEYDHYKLPELSYGQFHDGDTYVVRWQYMITASGIKSLKGHSARHSLTGREKCAYFFWQGNKSTVNEKGASALMTVELDEERGPQVRVVQGKEPPCFLNLFKGKMIIHIGKREDPSTNTQGSTRFYWVRGEFDNELCLVEIPLQMSNLRSRSSLLVLSVSTGLLYVWHGCKSLPHARNLALTAAQQLKSQCPLEVGLHKDACIVITEVEEGQETSAFWTALDGYYQNSYLSLIKDPKPYTHTIRIFNMCSVSGVLEVNEVPNPSRSEMTTPFPFLQSDLYKPAQPALFLIDNDHEVYLWQGWWPVATEEQENVKTGSAHARFNVDRKCAIQTAIDYCNEKNPDSPPGAYHVCAGVEPQCFTNLFPYWQVDKVVRDTSLNEGKVDGYIDRLTDVLTRLSKTRFTLEELQERPLPEGVDASKLEAYLDDEEFEALMEMNREEFYVLPSWRQRQLKQQAHLF